MKKEILFGVGGGVVCYQMGIIKWILENIDKNYLRQECLFGGASAGSVSSFFLVCCLFNIGDIDNWFNEIILKLFMKVKKSKTGAWLKINKMVSEVGKDIQKIIYKQRDITFLNGIYHILVTKIPELKKKIIKNFYNFSDFIEAIISSCYALLISNGFCHKYKQEWYSDGAYCGQVPSQYINSPKVYFSCFNHQETNCHTLNIYQWKTISIKDIWMWGDLEWCKFLFVRGYQDSFKNKLELFSCIMPSPNPIYRFMSNLLTEHQDSKKNNPKKTKATVIQNSKDFYFR